MLGNWRGLAAWINAQIADRPQSWLCEVLEAFWDTLSVQGKCVCV